MYITDVASAAYVVVNGDVTDSRVDSRCFIVRTGLRCATCRDAPTTAPPGLPPPPAARPARGTGRERAPPAATRSDAALPGCHTRSVETNLIVTLRQTDSWR